MKSKTCMKLSSVLIVLVMVFSLFVYPVQVKANPVQDFSDVSPSDWFYPYVMFMFTRGIVKGYGSSGEFRPANKVIREHAAKMICLLAELDYEGKDIDFVDKDQIDPTLIPYIAALVEKGAIGGYANGTFRPKNNIQRGHICKIVAHAFDLEMGELPVSLSDLPADDPVVAEAITILASNGIVSGYGTSGEFRPKNEVTRAEVSKILAVAATVAAVQKVEAHITLEGIHKAQSYLDDLPEDGVKAGLQERLDAIRNIRYPIYYENLEGGSNHRLNLPDYTIEETVTLLPASRRGHHFLGWYNQPAFGNEVDTIPAGTTGPVTVYARWAAMTYVVIFNSDVVGITPDPETKTVTYGAPYGKLATVVRPGYIFQGWYDYQVYPAVERTADSIVEHTNDHGLKAHWKPIEYDVVYMPNGGSGSMANHHFIYDEEDQLKTCGFTREGYTFEGWNTQANGSGTSYQPGDKVKNLTTRHNGKVYLYAQWKAKTVKVTFDGQGGVTPDPTSKTVTVGQPYGPLAYTYHKGSHGQAYKFTGWFGRDGQVSEHHPVEIGTDHTLLAKWQQRFYLVGVVFNYRVMVSEGKWGENNVKKTGKSTTWHNHGDYQIRVNEGTWHSNLTSLEFKRVGNSGENLRKLDLVGVRKAGQSVSGTLVVEVRMANDHDVQTRFNAKISGSGIGTGATVEVIIP